MFANPEAPETCHSEFVIEVSLHSHSWLNHGPSGGQTESGPSPRGFWVVLKIPNF